MAQPLIELYGPRERGEMWAAAAKIHLADGDLELIAKAPKATLARVISRVSALVAWHGSDETLEALKSALENSGFEVSGDRVYAGDYISGDVGGFFDFIGKGIASITRTPFFKNAAKMATACIPYVGPLLAGSGATDMAIDAAGAAVDKATAKKHKKKKVARQKIAKVAAQAKKGKRAAKRARKMLSAAARTKKALGRSGLRGFRALARSSRMLKRARAGDDKATRQISEILELARAGDKRAIEAAAFLDSARAVLEELQAVLAEERDRDELEDYELEDYEPEGYESELYELDFSPYEQAVGARLVRALTDQELIRRLKIYRKRGRGYRPPRRK